MEPQGELALLAGRGRGGHRLAAGVLDQCVAALQRPLRIVGGQRHGEPVEIAAAALEASTAQRARGPIEDASATATLRERGMRIRDIDARAWRPAAEALWQREARALGATAWLEAILA